MRIYSSCYDAISEVARDLVELGVMRRTTTMQDKVVLDRPEFSTKELMNYSLCLTRWDDEDLLFSIPADGDACRKWVQVEFQERIDPHYINPGDAWKIRKDMWTPFLRNGRFAYSYNMRIRKQFHFIREALRRDIFTRQAVLSIWDPSIDSERLLADRVPCSLTYHFIATQEQGKPIALNLIYTMRSCDFVSHFCNDTYLATMMLRQMCLEVTQDVEVGKLFMNFASLHYYQKDSAQMEKFMEVKR